MPIAQFVWIDLHAAKGTNDISFLAVANNGSGMNYETIRNHYLMIGKPKRRLPKGQSVGGECR
jgi:hypothetical protein